MIGHFGATDRYHRALLSLAESTDTWKARLCSAVGSIYVLEDSAFPDALLTQHTSLMATVTRVASEDTGAINATVYQMKESEGANAIKEIITIWEGLRAAERAD
jgi:hypothetical protein